MIDNKTGTTKYFEYGRYDKENFGTVIKRTVSDVVIDKFGKPTIGSLNKTLGEISQKAGHGGRIQGAYINSDKFKEMHSFALSKQTLADKQEGKRYKLFGNNCGHFADKTIRQDNSIKTPLLIDPRPTSMIDRYQSVFQDISYDPNSDKTTYGD